MALEPSAFCSSVRIRCGGVTIMTDLFVKSHPVRDLTVLIRLAKRSVGFQLETAIIVG